MYTQIRVSVFVCLAVVFLLLVGAGAIGAANGQFVAAAPPRPPVFEFLEFVGIILFGSHKTSRFFYGLPQWDCYSGLAAWRLGSH